MDPTSLFSATAQLLLSAETSHEDVIDCISALGHLLQIPAISTEVSCFILQQFGASNTNLTTRSAVMRLLPRVCRIYPSLTDAIIRNLFEVINSRTSAQCTYAAIYALGKILSASAGSHVECYALLRHILYSSSEDECARLFASAALGRVCASSKYVRSQFSHRMDQSDAVGSIDNLLMLAFYGSQPSSLTSPQFEMCLVRARAFLDNGSARTEEVVQSTQFLIAATAISNYCAKCTDMLLSAAAGPLLTRGHGNLVGRLVKNLVASRFFGAKAHQWIVESLNELVCIKGQAKRACVLALCSLISADSPALERVVLKMFHSSSTAALALRCMSLLKTKENTVPGSDIPLEKNLPFLKWLLSQLEEPDSQPTSPIKVFSPQLHLESCLQLDQESMLSELRFLSAPQLRATLAMAKRFELLGDIEFAQAFLSPCSLQLKHEDSTSGPLREAVAKAIVAHPIYHRIVLKTLLGFAAHKDDASIFHHSNVLIWTQLVSLLTNSPRIAREEAKEKHSGQVLAKMARQTKTQVDSLNRSVLLAPLPQQCGGLEISSSSNVINIAPISGLVSSSAKRRKLNSREDIATDHSRSALFVPPAVQEERTKQEPCRFWLAGKCTKSDCAFSHTGEPTKRPEICKYFKTKSCKKGDACPFSHDLKSVACDFMVQFGRCNYGNNCWFGHEQALVDAEKARLAQLEKEDAAKKALELAEQNSRNALPFSPFAVPSSEMATTSNDIHDLKPLETNTREPGVYQPPFGGSFQPAQPVPVSAPVFVLPSIPSWAAVTPAVSTAAEELDKLLGN